MEYLRPVLRQRLHQLQVTWMGTVLEAPPGAALQGTTAIACTGNVW